MVGTSIGGFDVVEGKTLMKLVLVVKSKENDAIYRWLIVDI